MPESFEIAGEILDLMGVGGLLEAEGGLIPINRTMAEFTQEFGCLDCFTRVTNDTGVIELTRFEKTAIFHVRRLTAAPHTIWIVEDVSERIRSERKRGQFIKLASLSPHPVFRVGLEGDIEYANNAGYELLEYGEGGEPAEFERRIRQAACSILQKRSGSVMELTVGGRIFSFILDYSEGADYVQIYGIDVTDRKYAEAALRRSEERFRSLLATAPDAILIITADGMVDYANREANRVFAYGKSLAGFPIEQLIPGPFFADRARWIASLKPGREEMTFAEATRLHGLRENGQQFPLEVRTSPFIRGDNRRLIAIVRDITERERDAAKIRRLNSQLAEHVGQLTELNRELEAFSYSVSHDLRAPLRSIVGFGEILLEDYAAELDSQASDYLRRIVAAGQSMAELIDGLLRLSRVSRTGLSPAPVDFAAMARSVAAALREAEPGHDVEFRSPESLEITGDRALLRVLLENLLGNAWKFTRGREKPEIELGVTEAEGHPVYYIRDNGAGFDMEYASRLFRPFERLHTQREFPGSGIGLATVERIVRRHGGTIWAEGNPGEGATFYFTLHSGGLGNVGSH